MKQLTEESFPYIKPPFVLNNEPEDKDAARK